MPLVRVEVRSEYALGAPELYTEADKEDPKVVLEGVAVAGLVGILRQLGDLAEFAAEVFHGLQEQVMITSSRSHKLMVRVQKIEAALPSLEKLVLAQRSHLHFAYTAGANWHSRLRCEQSHFIYNDLPRFIMDSYEHCRGPPRLDLLDKFDPGGPGSCLKKYSDPSFFKRASSGSNGAYVDKILKEKKGRKIKKKRSLHKTGEVSRVASFSDTSSRMQFASLNNDGQTSPRQMFSTKSDLLGDQSLSLGSRTWSGDLERVSHPSYSMDNVEEESRESYSSPPRTDHNDSDNYVLVDEKGAVLDDMRSSLSEDQTEPSSFHVAWDEKTQISESAAIEYEHDETTRILSMNFDLANEEKGAFNFKTAKESDHDENLETLAANFDGETEERGARTFKTAKEYDYGDTLEIVSMNFDLETEERGATHFTAAEGYDLDETVETLSFNFDLETEDKKDVHLESVGQMDIYLENENLSMPTTGDIQLHASESESVGQMNSELAKESVPMPFSDYVQQDDIESETDNYVDALNTIESEYETDVEVPTREDVEQYSDSDNKAIDSGVDMLTRGHSGNYSSITKSLITTSSSLDNGTLGDDPCPVSPETCSVDKVTSEDISDLLPLETCAFVQSPQIANTSLNSDSPPHVDSCEISDNLVSPNANSVMSNTSSVSTPQSLGVPASDKITSSSSELQKPSPEPSSITSVKFWTNGSLLGLEPSKPPDFTMLNMSSELSVKSKDDRIGTSTQQPDIMEKRSRSVEEAAVPGCSTSYQDDRKGGLFIKKTSWLFSSADLGVNLQKLTDSCNQSSIANSQHNSNSDTYGTVRPVSSDIQSTRASQEKSSNSSRMFELGNQLLMNGFHQKPSFDMDDNYNSNSSPNAGVFELKNSHPNVDNKIFSSSKGMLRIESTVVSPSSSPPLGHMKMSFQPVNGFEAHKLQLKFAVGNISRENGRDMFPSFQLVPEPTIPLHDTGSDSEDDTFCRSSPYGSDCLSHQSDSNSEQWESSESPTSKHHELYDTLRRISFTDSGPTSWDTGAAVQGEVNNNCTPQISLARKSVEHSQSGHLFDLPSLDTLQTSLVETSDCDLSSLTEPQCPKEPTPPPPPLPPAQWRAMKQQVELADDRQVVISENLSYAFDRKFGSTISQQPKPAPIKQEQITEAAHTLKSKQPQLKKTSRQKEVNRSVSLKEQGEKDFLHQIRTKSFNLRRTVTEKPTVTTGPPTSFQVTAILKKANEIRQVVGSDGEDDNWSDT